MHESRRPSRGWYGLAAGLLLVGFVVVVIGVARLVSNVASFEIAPVPSSSQVTIDERPLAVWSTAPQGTVRCTAEDVAGDDSTRALMGTTTITRGAVTWHKVTIVEGPPGSTHSLSCQAAGEVGISDDPRIWSGVRDMAVVLGVAGLSVLAALVITLVVFFRRRSAPGPASA